jgi:hypothetical protein
VQTSEIAEISEVLIFAATPFVAEIAAKKTGTVSTAPADNLSFQRTD